MRFIVLAPGALSGFAETCGFARTRFWFHAKPQRTAKDLKEKTALAETGKEKGKSMIWVMFALGAALSWGLYGPVLHKGQVAFGNPFRALLCVGVAYFLIGVLVPVIALGAQGGLKDFNGTGITWATLGGTLGAVGALCIIYAFKSGGIPTYVMPLVFGGAPIVNVLFSMWQHPPKTAPNPLLYLGFVLVATGAGLVLYFKPQS